MSWRKGVARLLRPVRRRARALAGAAVTPAEAAAAVRITGDVSQRYFYLGPDLALTRLTMGPMLYVDPQDEHVSANIIAHGYWEPWVHATVLSLLAPGARVVEVGANVGYYTILMAARVGPAGRVTALEANPRLVDLVRRSVTLNGFADRVRLIGKAAMDQPGTIEFVTSRRNSGGGYVTIWDQPPYEDAVTSRVEAVRLDDVETGRVDMIRIDAEGSEAFILRGAAGLLAANPDIVVCMEWSVEQIGSRTPVTEFVDWLAGQGFRFWRIGHDAGLTEVPAAAMAGLPPCDLVVARAEPRRDLKLTRTWASRPRG